MTTQHRTLFLTDRSPRHQVAAQQAAPAVLDLTFLRRPARAELLAHLADVEILISERADTLDAALLDAAPKLRLILRLGSLTYDIDVAMAHARGIAVCYWPIRGCIMVAEHLLLQMLALVKRLPEVKAVAEAAADWGQPSRRTDENTFAYNWSGRAGIEGIYGQTVGILGFGEIGAELARRLRPLAPAQVLYHKRQPLPATVERELGITYAEPAALIAQADFLCSLLPYTPATDLLLNGQSFAAMKPGTFVVSCGSGSVIDEAALADALQSGQLGGAALDTFEWEPLRPDSPLLPLARDTTMNLLLTPHTAAGAPQRQADTKRNAEFTNVLRFLAGESLLYPVNP
jgi:phosphoglycerate dehydrogenase-like enzyme